MEALYREIDALQKRLAALETQEYSKIVVPPQIARVYDDRTSDRSAGYSANIQVTGVADLPTNITAVRYNITLRAINANTTCNCVIENPDSIFGAQNITLFSMTAGGFYCVGGETALSSTGQLRFVIASGNFTPLINGIIVDVTSYKI